MKIWALLVAQVIGGLVLLRGADALGLPDRYLFGAGALLLVALLIREAGGARTGEAQGFAVAQGLPVWPGLVLAAVSGFGLLGGLAALMSGGATGLAVIAGLIAGLALSFAMFAAPLGRSPSATLADHFRDHFGPFAGSVAAWSIGLVAFAALVLQLLLAASLLRAGFGLPGVPAILGLALLIGIGLYQRGAAGAADLCRAALPVLLALMVPAVWLSSSATGLLVPQLSWGLLLQELNAAERLAGADALYLALEPESFALTALGVGLGAAVLPQGLNCLASAATGEAARRALMPGYALVLLVLLALPLIAVAARLAAPLAGNALPGMAPETALAAMVGLLEPPAWLLATGAVAVLAAIAGASVSATVTVLGALGLHRAGGMAEGSAGRSRNALMLVLLFAVSLAILAPVEPVQGHASLLVIAGAALLAPLGLALHWPRLSDAGLILGILSGGGGAVALILMAAQAGTLDLHTGLAALPLSALVTIAASLIWPPQPTRYGLLQMPEALPPPDRD